MDKKDLVEFLDIVKLRLFEPRKKIECDNQGYKRMVNCANPQDNNKTVLSNFDRKRVELGEGWNVADKDYVDLKVLSLYTQIKHQFEPQLLAKQTSSNNSVSSLFSKSSKSTPNTIVLHCVGNHEDKVLKFFNPGVVLKKGWTIAEVFLRLVPQEDEEIVLQMINTCDQTTSVISKNKISTTNKKAQQAAQTLLVNEPKIVVDSTGIYAFEIKLSGKNANTTGFLQFLIETDF